MNESKEIIILRQMAWERAKGELLAMLGTYWSPSYPKHHPEYDGEIQDATETLIKKFIGDIEDLM